MDLPEKENRMGGYPMMIFVHVDAAERSQCSPLSSAVYGAAWRTYSGGDSDEQMERFKFMLDYSDEAVEMCATIGSEN